MQNKIRKFTVPVLTWHFCFFFLLNFISNLAYTRHDNSAWALFAMMSMAGLFAYLEASVVCLLHKLSTVLANTALVLIAAIHTVIIVTDYALLILFWKVIDQTVIDILAEANEAQASDFLQTYFGPLGIALVIGTIILLNASLYYISRLYYKISYRALFLLLPLAGVFCTGRVIVHFKQYGTALFVPSYVAPTRIAYATSVLYRRQREINRLVERCKLAEAKCKFEENPDIVLIIGESCSKYHCSLYGYSKQTFPILQKKKNSGRLVLFDDAVAVADATHENMRAFFTLGSGGDDFCNNSLMPTYFQAAGYKTALYDNQYLLGQGVSFLTDKNLSAKLWNKRNTQGAKFDGAMIKTVQLFSEPGLYVFHLWGQHYDYKNRYPENHQIFSAKDYDTQRYSEKQRTYIAQYDNACHYNDAVVSSIFDKFSQRNAIIIFLSDHGEELYEVADFRGHGTCTTTKDWHYQLCVPLMMYATEKYEAQHKDICERIKASAHRRIATKDLAHVLMDLAGIETKDYDSKRDFISQDYDSLRHRVAMGMIDVDK